MQTIGRELVLLNFIADKYKTEVRFKRAAKVKEWT